MNETKSQKRFACLGKISSVTSTRKAQQERARKKQRIKSCTRTWIGAWKPKITRRHSTQHNPQHLKAHNLHTKKGKEIFTSSKGIAQSTKNNTEPKGSNNDLAKIPKENALAED